MCIVQGTYCGAKRMARAMVLGIHLEWGFWRALRGSCGWADWWRGWLVLVLRGTAVISERELDWCLLVASVWVGVGIWYLEEV